MPDTTIPTLTFQNNLPADIIVYDSFDDAETDSDDNTDENYFGTLTQLGTVTANTSAVLQPIHRTSVFIITTADGKPVKRCYKLGSQKTLTAFTIAQADQDTMTAMFQFIDFYTAHPDDPLSTQFAAILKGDADSLYTNINSFFQSQPAYSSCTFPDYMMGITYRAMNPPPPDTPAAPPTYSLQQLVKYMGGVWPDGFPDISVTNFNCTNKNDRLVITADIDFTGFTFETAEIRDNICQLLSGHKQVKVTISFNYAISLAIFGTRIVFNPDNFQLNNSIQVQSPAVIFDINPLFKFVVFTVEGTIPFNVDNTALDADISFVVDNDEAAVNVTIAGDNTSFPPPPGLKGLFFDSVGVGLGIFFKPPALSVGLQGKFHIGGETAGNDVSLDDDTFALVCKVTGDAITPAFLSFYVPKLDLATIIALFTNAQVSVDVPITFEELSFSWVDSMMSAYVLPDGTLSPGGYAFSAICNVGPFGFYGSAALDLNNGLTANIEVSPVQLGKIFQFTGDGQGFSVKEDANGNPIKNNFIPVTQADKDAVANATTRQVVAPGGACLIINTLQSPILHLNAKASLFELINADITADINKQGIAFELDYGAILKTKMSCTLADFHNLSLGFVYGLDLQVSLPAVNGVSLGNISLVADANIHAGVSTSTQDIVFSVGGGFDFEGLQFTFGDFSADVNISKVTDLVEAIGTYIKNEASTIFKDLVGDADKWLEWAKQGIVTGITSAGNVLNKVFGKGAQDVVNMLRDAGYQLQDIVSSLKGDLGMAPQEVAGVLKVCNYAAAQVAGIVRYTWGCAMNDVGYAMEYGGWALNDMAVGLQSAFNCSYQDVANTFKNLSVSASETASVFSSVFHCDVNTTGALLKNAGYDLDSVAGALKDVFNTDANTLEQALKVAGYAESDIKSAFKSLGGEFKKWFGGIF